MAEFYGGQIRFCGGEILIENRPDFRNMTSFEEFNKYYWYREELSQICKSEGLENRGTLMERYE